MILLVTEIDSFFAAAGRDSVINKQTSLFVSSMQQPLRHQSLLSRSENL